MAKHKPYDESEWPSDKMAFRIIVCSGVDSKGRERFDALWWTDDGQRRGQSFCAHKAITVKSLESTGRILGGAQ